MAPDARNDHGVVALVGPTGAGKSALALEAAERAGAEIVAVDAFTVYRSMEIGTAKPSVAARRRVRHHMVDVLEPSQECTVRWFQTRARRVIADLSGRDTPALLVGGSGLYFRATVDPLEFPPSDAEVRARVAARFDNAKAAHAALARVDPAAAARIDPSNARRSVRALEVLELTGRPFSHWRRVWERYEPVYPRLRVFGVALDRAELADRIAARVEAMLAAGLVEECRALADRPMSLTARQAIGYAEVLDHLAGRCSLAEAADRIRARSRRYAARQQRWFQSDPRVRWLAPAQVAAELTAALRSAVGEDECTL